MSLPKQQYIERFDPPSTPPPRYQSLPTTSTTSSPSAAESASASSTLPKQQSSNSSSPISSSTFSKGETIYFKSRINAPHSDSHVAARYRSLDCGPFHSSLGPLPEDEDELFSREITSPFLLDLLYKLETVSEFLLPPQEDLDLPEMLDRIAQWDNIYPHILHSICLPARLQWTSRYPKLRRHNNWTSGKIDYLESQDELKEWDEMVMYLKLEKTLKDSYYEWVEYSNQCFISIHYDKMLRDYYSDRFSRLYASFGGARSPVPKRPTDIIALLRSLKESAIRTTGKLIGRHDYDQVPVPSSPSPFSPRSIITGTPIIVSALVSENSAPQIKTQNTILSLSKALGSTGNAAGVEAENSGLLMASNLFENERTAFPDSLGNVLTRRKGKDITGEI